MCYDCAATQPAHGQEQRQGGEEYDESWAHGYRASYYSSTGYRPSSTYDSSDARSFDERHRLFRCFACSCRFSSDSRVGW